MVKKKDLKKINHVEKDFVKIFKLFLELNIYGEEKAVMALIALHLSKYITIIIIYFFQEIQKIK
jgi:hypothetical protein